MEEGFIYKWVKTPELLTFYIGRTSQTLKAREAEHRAKPTNPDMAEALKQPCKMVEVEHWLCSADQLGDRETKNIHDAQLNGAHLLNVYKKQVEVFKEKTEVKHTVAITRFHIYDDPIKKQLRIRCVINNIDKKKLYNIRPYAEVYAKMEVIRAELIKKYIA